MVEKLHFSLGGPQVVIPGFRRTLVLDSSELSPKDFYTVSSRPFLQEAPLKRKCREKRHDGDIGIPGGRMICYGMTLFSGLPFIATGGVLLAKNEETWGALALGAGIALSAGLTLYVALEENKECDESN